MPWDHLSKKVCTVSLSRSWPASATRTANGAALVPHVAGDLDRGAEAAARGPQDGRIDLQIAHGKTLATWGQPPPRPLSTEPWHKR